MSYPDSFYYQAHSASDFVLTNEPGEIDMDSLMNRAPKFFKEEGAIQLQKKTLVIKDWTAEQWSDEEVDKQIKYYSDLLKDEFEIYAWQAPNSLVKLSLSNINKLKDFSFRVKMTPVRKSHIEQLMAKKNIPAKQMECLPINSEVWLSDVIGSRYHEAEVIQYIIDEHKGIITNETINEQFGKNHDTRLQSKFKDLSFTTQKKREINPLRSLVLHENACLTLKKLSLKHLALIEELSLHPKDQDDFSILSECFTHTSNLKKLTLNSSMMHKLDTITLSNIMLEKLEELNVDLKESVYFWDEIHKDNEEDDKPLLAIENFLKVLPKIIKLKQLKLDLDYHITKAQFLSILQHINNVESFTFIDPNLAFTERDFSKENTPLEFLHTPLPKLETLAIKQICNPDLFLITLEKAINLKSLHLRFSSFTSSPLGNLKFNNNTSKVLSKLENLKIDFSSTEDTDGILILLKKTKNLKSLTLRSFSMEKETNAKSLILEILPKNTSNTLETLILIGPTNKKVLKQFLAKAQNLQILDLSKCSNIKHINLSKFPHLKDLIILYPQNRNIEKPAALNSQSNSSRGLKNKTVDADTTYNKNKIFNVTTMFWGMDGMHTPPPNNYRIQVKNAFRLQEDIKKPFKLKNNVKLALTEPKNKFIVHENDTYKLKKPLHYYAKTNITLTNEWQPLPSLSAQEYITDIHVNGINNKAVDIQYSERDNLYYIKNKTKNAAPTPITIDFRLKAPDITDRSGNQCSAKILKLVKKYQAYTIGTLNVSANATSAERLKALQTQNVGACRHRTIALMAEIQALYPDVEVRIINNECHSFIEVREQKEDPWICCDLGGYPAELNINNDNEPLGYVFNKWYQKIIYFFLYLGQLFFDKIASFFTKKPKTTPAVPPASKTTEPELTPEMANIDIEASGFNTWKKTQAPESTITAYLQKILNGKYGHKKTLVDFESEKMSDDFGLLLKKQCIDTHRPVYYVNSAVDLKCAIDWIERIPGTNEGISKEGPGGPLYEFFKKYEHNTSDQSPVIIINWDNFDADQVIQNNGIISNPRILEGGLKLPKSFHIIGLRTPNRVGAYTKEDFDSRFEETTLCPFSPETLQAKALPLTAITTPKTDAKAQSVIIDLYESTDWKSLLLGQWGLEGEKFVFIKGALETALKKAKKHNLPLEIKNGPWQNKHFAQFWQQAKLDKLIGNNIPIITSQGYDWNELSKEVKWSFNGISKKEDYLLNPGTFGKYFSQTIFKKENSNAFETQDLQLYRQAGWLEKNKGKALTLYLTQALSTHQWARLFAFAKKQKVLLDIHVAPGLSLPEGFPKPAEAAPIISKHPCVFISKDIDYAVHQLKKEHDNKNTIFDLDISECEASDLLIAIKPHWTKKENGTGSCHFSQKVNVLLAALKKGDTVILKGKFKPALINALASLCLEKPYLWVNGEKQYYKGTCLFVTDEKEAKHFSFAHPAQVLVPAKYEHKSFIRIKTEKEYLKHYPNNNPEDNWQGLEHIEHAALPDSKTKFDLSLKTSQKFEKERFATFKKALKRPHVIITGKTGVGKTAFIKELAKNTNQYKVHYGKSAYATWAQDNQDPTKIKILFIDEANIEGGIEGGDFSAFESIDNTPPHLLVKGSYYPLTPQHKVVFACNPKSYGNRGMPSFFARRGGAITFHPLSEAYLYNKILKPVFEGSHLTSDEEEKISIDILKTYRYINALPSEHSLISPRELQMMAVLISIHPQYKTYYLQSIAQQCIPAEHKEKFAQWYTQMFGSVTIPIYKQTPVLSNKVKTKFVLTQSRLEAYNKVMDFLELRKFKQTTSNPIARYAGLGGMIFEGEPGIGKSQFIIDVLRSHNFEEAKFFDPKKHTGKFYTISASMSISKKEKIRFEAFNTGSILIEDEINSGPMKEDSSNAYLMGHDLENNPPKVAGFIRFVTQNPISMDGRLATSIASERRNMKVELPQYTSSEMQQILIKKGLDPQSAFNLVQEYTTVREYGLKYHKKPLPTFRKLKQKAKIMIKAQKKNSNETIHNTHKKYPSSTISQNGTEITVDIIPNKIQYQISSAAQGKEAYYTSIISKKITQKQKTLFLKKVCTDAIACAPKNQVFIISKQSSIEEENEIEKQLKRAIRKIDNKEKRLTIERERDIDYSKAASNSGKRIKRSPTNP